MEAHLSHSAGCIISFTFPTILHPNPSHPNSLANLLLVMFEYKQLFWSTLQSDVLLLKLKQNGQLQWKIHLSDDFQGNAVSISHIDTLYPGNTVMCMWAQHRGILSKAVFTKQHFPLGFSFIFTWLVISTPAWTARRSGINGNFQTLPTENNCVLIQMRWLDGHVHCSSTWGVV